MKSASDPRARARTALQHQFAGPTDAGYVDWPQANLVPGVRLEQFESDLRRGDGGELRMKFCAVHSSAALAVNCFAPFKDKPDELVLLDTRGAVEVQFEKRLQIIPGRRPSNLDVWIDRGTSRVGIESKLLEYFEPKAPEFAPAYRALAPPVSESWLWEAYEDCLGGAPQHLDRAQLVKHYFGLSQLHRIAKQRENLTLLYLFWEPLNWQDIEECRRHREEAESFATQAANSSIPFHWMTYSQLWQEWTGIPGLEQHAANLKARYEVCI